MLRCGARRDSRDVTGLSVMLPASAETRAMIRIQHLLLAGLASFAATALAAETPLAVPEIHAFMAEVAAASNTRDAERIAATLAADCRIELRTELDGREQISLFTRADYVAMLKSGYAGLAELTDYDYRVDAQRITLETDPPGATVVSNVTERFTFQGRAHATHSEETARVERRGGKPMVVAVSSLTRGD
jgi:hypothetical protein